jgi:DNA-binding transcriptional LysR family regulator
LNLRSLRLFRYIILTGSLVQAADRLNLSASAASRMLSQLEHDCGLTLFTRVRRRLELTENGEIFFRQIANTLIGIDEIATIAADIRRGTGDWLSVVTSAPVANGLVIPGIARMKANGTRFQCTVNVESRFDVESKVAARGYNLGIISLPVENAIIDLKIEPFVRSRICVLMPESHPLTKKLEVSTTDMGDELFATLAPGQRWRERLEELMGEGGRSLNIPFETGSTLVTIEMVRSGLGLTLIDAVCAPKMPSPGLAMRPIAGDHWITYASLHPNSAPNPLSRLFLDAVSAQVEEMRQNVPIMHALLELI